MFGSPTAFLIASMITLAAAGGDYSKCETSDGSPWAYDCNNALLDLDDSKCYDVRRKKKKTSVLSLTFLSLCHV
jgi:hypothetical protein